MLEVCSLNVIMTDSGVGSDLAEQVKGDVDVLNETIDKIYNVKMLKDIKGALKPKEYKIFIDHAIDGKTYSEIAVGLECTQQNVHRIYADCITKLKNDYRVRKYKKAQ